MVCVRYGYQISDSLEEIWLTCRLLSSRDAETVLTP